MLFDAGIDPATRTTAIDGVKRIQRLFQVSTDPITLGLLACRRSNPAPAAFVDHSKVLPALMRRAHVSARRMNLFKRNAPGG
jgi:hypothetical protein